MNTRIQTTIDLNTSQLASQKFAQFGLDINEGVRMLLTSFVTEKIKLIFETTEYIKLSDQAKNRYKLILKDIGVKKNITNKI